MEPRICRRGIGRYARDRLELRSAAPDEQALLRRLAIFVGSWTLEAAAAIGATGGEVNVLDGLQSLIDTSLIYRADGLQGEPRYGMLELIREFALEQLLAGSEEAELQARHGAYYTDLGESVEAQLAQGQEAHALARIAADAENLRAAMQWSRTSDPTAALALASVFAEYCLANGSYREGRRWLADSSCMTPVCPRRCKPKRCCAPRSLSGAWVRTTLRWPKPAAGSTSSSVTAWAPLGRSTFWA